MTGPSQPPPTQPPPSRAWRLKIESLRRELDEAERRSPILRVLRPPRLEGGDPEIPGSGELRTIVGLEIPTLARVPSPTDDATREAIALVGPVLLGVRYHETFLTRRPVPWEVVTILGPPSPFHPNVHPSGGLCLGEPPVGIGMEALLHLAFAAVVLASHNTIEWQGLNPEASRYVRERADRFPIVETGLFEAPPEELRRPIPTGLIESVRDDSEDEPTEVSA